MENFLRFIATMPIEYAFLMVFVSLFVLLLLSLLPCMDDTGSRSSRRRRK